MIDKNKKSDTGEEDRIITDFFIPKHNKSCIENVEIISLENVAFGNHCQRLSSFVI